MRSLVRSTIPVDVDRKPFVASELEADVREALVTDFAPHRQINVVPTNPLPAYVEHHQDADQVGRLTAEAVVHQYEATAQSVEEMGIDLKAYAKFLIEELERTQEAVKYVADTVQSIRDEGKRSFERVQQRSMITTQVRDACAEIRNKIAAQD